MSGVTLFHNVNAIIKALFDREEANITKREQALMTKHTSLGGSMDGFRYRGVIYTMLTGAGRQRGTFTPLKSELVADMDLIRSDRDILNEDRDRIRQALFLVLKKAHSYQEIRDALPNCVKDVVPQIAGLERTRPEAWTLADNPRSYTQYMKLREKLEFYAVSRLLY